MTSRQTRRIDINFELGSIGSEVTVKANAAVIATEGSQVAGGFNRKNYVDSPTSVSFFPQAFMLTLPNVQSQSGSYNLRIAGQPSAQVSEALDGVPTDGPVNLVQNMNDFEELQVVGANNSAEFSRVTSFSMTGKSGTNDFHGFASLRISKLGLKRQGLLRYPEGGKPSAPWRHQCGRTDPKKQDLFLWSLLSGADPRQHVL